MSKYKLAQGDCLELMKKIKDESIDLILCDLPYGTSACKWDSVIPFEPMWEQYKRIVKLGGHCSFWCRTIFFCFANEQFKYV